MRLFDAAKLAIVGIALGSAVLIAAKRPTFMDRAFRAVEAFLSQISRSGPRASLLIVLLGLVVHASLAGFIWWPHARIADEVSYLLQADTFNRGRLANPQHPMARYLETPFVLQKPSYASIYPPGQGMFLAVGKRLGNPAFGSWISIISAALAIYYLLIACLPSQWALCGALLFTLHPVAIYWGQNYWGGAPQTTGGALLLGAGLRAYRSPNWFHGMTIGIGAFLLSISRPFEGAVLCFGSGSIFAFHLLKQGRAHATQAGSRIALGLLPIVGAMFLFHAAYNQAVTGNPLKMPYMAYQDTAAKYPVFIWQKPGPLPYIPYQNVRDITVFERDLYLQVTKSFASFLREKGKDIANSLGYLTWYCGFIIPIGFGLASRREIHMFRLGFGILLISISAETTVVYLWPHYLGPVFGLLICLSIAGLRELRRRYGIHGVCFVRVFASLLVALALGVATGRNLRARADTDRLWPERFSEQLQHLGGKHLIVVQFPENQPWITTRPWINNEADVDASHVVWAQSLGDNTPLLHYFKARKAWLLSLDATNSTLSPYFPGLSVE